MSHIARVIALAEAASYLYRDDSKPGLPTHSATSTAKEPATPPSRHRNSQELPHRPSCLLGQHLDSTARSPAHPQSRSNTDVLRPPSHPSRRGRTTRHGHYRLPDSQLRLSPPWLALTVDAAVSGRFRPPHRRRRL